MKTLFLISIFSLSLFGNWFDDIYRNIFKIDSCQSQENRSFNQSWQPFIEKSNSAIEKFNKIDKEKIEDSWLPFVSTKENIREDFNSILNDMISTLTEDTKVMECLQEMRRLNRKILDEKDGILKIKEQNISGIDENTKKEIEEKFKKILKLQENIKAIRKSILLELKKLGLNLRSQELEALLVRIDSENIIQIMVIFDISKKIILKLEELMRLNSEDLKISKRYYGMNLILSEIAFYVQKKYIDSIDRKYIPKLNKIILKVDTLIGDTEYLLKNSSTKYEKDIYRNNIKSQKLTVKTAKFYIQNLVKQREQINIAKERSIKNLNLTRNSYRTMEVGSKLLNLIQSTQQSFSQIMSIQLPEIIPFQNKNIEREYKKLTEELRN